jgi:carboxyl-terminal processing protease
MTTSSPNPRPSVLQAAILMVLIVLLAGGMAIYVVSDPGFHDASKLAQVANIVDQYYPEPVDWKKATRSALGAMFAKLDRFSSYLEPRRWRRFNEEFSGSYTGLGISVTPHDGGLLIMSVREGGPAAESGIFSGDVLIAADSVALGGLDPEDATDLLRGEAGSDVALRIYRPVDGDTLSFKVTRRKIDLEHIPFAGYTPDTVLYIRLLDFEAGASHDVKAALDSLLHEDSLEPHGVILDLRGNPGGLLSEGFGVANLFLDAGQLVVGTEGRSRWEESKYESSGHDLTGGLPMAVLVDRGSASAAEIVAGSLHQLHRAVLVGDTTFGKGLVQGFTSLANGGAVRLTIARYYLAGGLFLNRFDSVLVDTGRGLVPDYQVDFIEREPFPMELERSLLLNRFANQHQDEIVASGHFALDDRWVERFRDYAHSQDFVFESATTEKLKSMADLASLDHALPVKLAVDRLLTASRAADAQQFGHYGDYIKMRLKQLAFERKDGDYVAYARAVVPERPDIRLAARLLREKQ